MLGCRAPASTRAIAVADATTVRAPSHATGDARGIGEVTANDIDPQLAQPPGLGARTDQASNLPPPLAQASDDAAAQVSRATDDEDHDEVLAGWEEAWRPDSSA